MISKTISSISVQEDITHFHFPIAVLPFLIKTTVIVVTQSNGIRVGSNSKIDRL